MKIQNKSKGVLLIRVGFVALIFLFVYLYRFSNSKISQLNPSATATTTPTSTSAPTMLIPTPYEKVENGVYTNYKYGIRFKYPNNIFITFINHAYENNDPKNKSHLVEFRDVPEHGYPVRKYNLRVYMAYDSKFVGSPAGFGLNFDDYYNRVVGAPLFSQDEEKTKVHNDIKVKNIK